MSGSLLASRMPEDLPETVQKQPSAVPELLQAVKDLTVEQLRKLLEGAKRMKKEMK